MIEKKILKNIIISVALLLGMITNSLAQQTDTSPLLTREAYLKKSKDQKAGSGLLVLAGVTIGLVGGIIGLVSAFPGSAPSGNAPSSFPLVPVALGVGVGCVVGGAALSEASYRNEQKALDASAHFNLQRVSSFPFTALEKPYIPIPAITIKLDLH